ncbi:MAG TPA: CRTAC1 family protein [Candidatus Sulfotelmatobacter sp.]|nr:CRTAC1 family protein [Candidatus Sulfotelmatobacter sp.]
MKFAEHRRRRGFPRWSRVLFAGGCFACAAFAADPQQNREQKQPAKPIAYFTDIAKKAGLTMINTFGGVSTKKYIIETTGTGVAIFDADNDGWPDIFIANGTKLEGEQTTGEAASNHFYHNNHDGTFTDITKKAGLVHIGWGQGVCVGDYDNDGWPDLYVTYYGKNVLYHNNGDGTFTDVSEKSGVAGTGKAWGTGCAFVDYDRDGHLDLMVANYVDFDLAKTPAPGERVNCLWKGVPVMCGPQGLPTANNILYHNRGDGTFEDVTKKAHIDETNGHYAFSVTTLDYDDDGWPDMYVACDSTASILYHNNHDGTFKDVAITAGAAFNEDGHAQAGMGSTAGDYNGDGRLDIFKTNFSDDTATLYRNNGDGTFDDVTFAAGLGLHTQYLGWGTMFFDFDNDGWPDLMLVNGHVYPEVDSQHLGSNFQEPRILYHNNGNGTFADISANAGPGITNPSSSRGLAIGDLWNDGKLSAVVSNMNAAPSLLVNQVRTPNHWVAFRLKGAYPTAKPLEAKTAPQTPMPTSTRDAIGARIKVKVGGRILVDEVRSGSSFISNNDMRVHFGLGAATKIDSVEVRWSSGLIETFDKVAIDSISTLSEGSGTAPAKR